MTRVAKGGVPLMAALIVGCGSGADATRPLCAADHRNDGGEQEPAPVETPPAEAVVIDQWSLEEAVQRLVELGGRPVVIAPDAQDVATCARLTYHHAQSASADNLAPLLLAAIEGGGFRIDEDPHGLVVHSDPDRVFLLCMGPRAPHPLSDEEYESLARGVRAVGEHDFEITRYASERMRTLAHRALWSTRVLPHEDGGGAVVGVKIYGVRRRSVVALLGLENGDVITHAGGRAIDEDSPMLSLARDGDGDSFELRVLRRGEPLTFRYTLVQTLPSSEASEER